MPLYTSDEALYAADAFMNAVCGDDVFQRWKELKYEMEFETERDYMNWLIDIAYHYRNTEMTQSDESQSQYQREKGLPKMKQDVEPEVSQAVGGNSHGKQRSQIPQTATGLGGVHSSAYQESSAAASDEMLIKDETGGEGGDGSNVRTYGYAAFTDQTNQQDHSGTCGAAMDESEVYLSSDDDASRHIHHSAGITSQLKRYGDHPLSPHLVGAGTEVVGKEMKKFTCPHCSYASNLAANVRRHMRGIHDNVKPHACPYCDYSSSQKAPLQNHLINKHGYTSKYQCQFCGKGHHTPSLLQRHQAKCIKNSSPDMALPICEGNLGLESQPAEPPLS